MDRRMFLRQTGGALALTTGGFVLFGGGAWAQDASPTVGASALSGLGMPEITITLDDTGFTISPSQVEAGWTLVTFQNNQAQGDNGPDIMMLPQGESMESVVNLDATPSAAAPPAWVYQTAFAGGPYVGHGKTAQTLVLLDAGDWMIWSGGSPLKPVALTVTPAMASPAAEPSVTADVEIKLAEYNFVGLDKPMSAGEHVWKITNVGAQPHLMILGTVPAGTTKQQVIDAIGGMMSGTPVPNSAIDLTQASAGGIATLSSKRTTYLSLNLDAGTYMAICFFPDEKTGAPHVMMGMAAVFTVS